MSRAAPVLVLGGSGFVGGAVVEALRRAGVPVVATYARRPGRRAAGVRWARLDLDRAGARPPAGPFRAAVWAVWDDGTRPPRLGRLLAAWRAGGAPPRLVLLSSAAAQRPRSRYGRHKAREERRAAAWGRAAGAEVVVLRLFNIVGAGNARSVLHDVLEGVRRSRARRPLVAVGDVSAVRDYVEIRDVAEAAARAALRPVPSGRYDVASGRGRRVGDVLRALARAVERRTGRRIAWTRRPDAPARGALRSVGDPRPLGRAADWRARVALDDALRRLVSETLRAKG